jgi:putative ABC transport system substrate-binding protein
MTPRRTFLAGLGAAAGSSVIWPLAAAAQQPALPVIGYLDAGSSGRFPQNLEAFRQGLGEAGFAEGRNVTIEYGWGEGRAGRLSAVAADFIARKVTVIAATGGINLGGLALQAQPTTVPIVFMSASDPVASGLVASLNRPGGYLTGVSNLAGDLLQKKLELLHEVVPTATNIAVLVNRAEVGGVRTLEELHGAADTLGLRLQATYADIGLDLDGVFANLHALRNVALLVPPGNIFLDRRDELGALSSRYGIPAIYTYREFAVAGGLMSYGGDLTESYHIVGAYTGRVLRGERPADLPIQQLTKIKLVLNMRTAKALGITVPISLLGRADEVIE